MFPSIKGHWAIFSTPHQAGTGKQGYSSSRLFSCLRTWGYCGLAKQRSSWADKIRIKALIYEDSSLWMLFLSNFSSFWFAWKSSTYWMSFCEKHFRMWNVKFSLILISVADGPTVLSATSTGELLSYIVTKPQQLKWMRRKVGDSQVPHPTWLGWW